MMPLFDMSLILPCFVIDFIMMGNNYFSYLILLMVLVIGLLHHTAKGEKFCDDPCEKAFCARYPMADCRRSLGDKCKAEFFYDPKKPIDDCFNGDKCVEDCPRHFNPLCGSDGKTYGNECTFAAAKCKSKGTLSFKNKGPCV